MVLLAAFGLAACAGNPPVRIAAPFSPAQARAMLESGDNQIVGRAILWLSSGAVISCAGEAVTLYPATAYARDWARLSYETVDPDKPSPPNFHYRSRSEGPVKFTVDQAFLDLSRTVPCDPDGNFIFANVGNGEFYVVARIAWQRHIWDEHSFFYGNEYYSHEGTFMKKVRVSGRQKALVDMLWSAPNSRYGM